MMKLMYEKPAQTWTEALPIGNGRMGAMIFGGIEQEHLQINEDTLWSGGPQDGNNEKAKELLPTLRKRIAEEKYVEADQLSKQMMGPYTQSYLPFGNINIQFYHGDYATDYTRELDLESAVSSVSYKIGNTTYKRAYFSSYPDQAIMMRFECNKRGRLNFAATFSSSLKTTVTANGTHLILEGQAPKHVEPNYVSADEPVIYDSEEGMRFEGRLSIKLEDGQAVIENGQLTVEDATKATLYFTAATSFNGYDRSPVTDGRDPSRFAKRDMELVKEKSYDELLENHLSDYKQLFDRTTLTLASDEEIG